MKKYWIIAAFIGFFNLTLKSQDIPTIEIPQELFQKQDSIRNKAIEIKKYKWQKKLDQLQSLGRKPKIGLVLSGGGAKGFAHIAILEALEKYNISIDYIGGTSVGALVGGLYAVGYTAHQIDSIFSIMDFNSLFNDEYSRIEKPFMDRINNNDKYLLSLPFSSKGFDLPISYSKGQKLADVLTHLLNYNVATIHDFSKLPIPFFCIATNLTTGKEKIFDKGYLTEALLASMALPSLFTPVRIEDTLFIDGGITNNLPADEMKLKGMDIVIAVDISDKIEKPTLNSIVSYMDYLFSLMIQNNVNNQTKYADIIIRPDITNFSSISFKNKDSIYQKGIDAATVYEKQFKDLSDICNEYPTQKTILLKTTLPSNILITKISVLGSSDSFVIAKSDKVKLTNIEQNIKRTYSTGFYNKIYYTLDTAHNNTYQLNIHMEESPYNNFLKIGIHYDQVYSLGLLLNYTVRKKFLSNNLVRQIDFSIEGVASNLYRGELHYFQYNRIIPNFGLNAYYAFVTPSIYTNVEQQNVATPDFRTINMQMFNAEFYLNYIIKQLFAVNAGIETQYASFKISQNPLIFWYNGWNFNIFGSIVTDRRNNVSFPSAGFLFNGEYKLIPIKLLTNFNIAHYLKASIDGYIPIVNNIFSVGLGASGGYLSENLPNYMFSIGGTNTQPYFNNEQFAGYHYASLFSTFYMKGNIGLQVRFYKKHYIQAKGNILTSLRQDVLVGIPKNFNGFDLHYGLGIGYGWDSPIGPIKLSYNYAPSAKNFLYEENALKGVFFISIGHVF